MLAMRRAVFGLAVQPHLLLVDGNRLPRLEFYGGRIRAEAIIGGDAKETAISAASILAKVARDRTMEKIDCLYPDYGFGQHKGYGTAAHRAQLGSLGPCPQHRKSFRPISCTN